MTLTHPQPLQSAADAEAQEFGDWRWGRPAPHYTASRSSSGGSQSSSGSFGTSYGSSSSSSSGGMGGASFLSRAVSSAFGGSSSNNNNNSSSLLGKASTIKPAHAMVGCVVPDGGDAEAASLDQLLPQAVAHYVNRRMRYDVFLQFRDMLV